MKLLNLIFILCFALANAQETVWFDAEWQETTKEKASFYRPTPSKIKKGYWVIDYYKDGSIKREGYAKRLRRKKTGFDGLVIEYYKNGKTFLQTNYKNGQLHGICKEHFDSGELKTQYRYKNGKRDGVWKEFYKTGKIKTKGRYKEGEKVGVWKSYYKNTYESFFDY